jgi:CHAT domain-containing protein
MKRLGVIILLMTFALGISAQENKDSLRVLADTLANSALSAYEIGDYQNALDKQKLVVEIYEKIENKESADYATSLSYLAGYYSELGNYQKAIEIGIKALKIRESVLGRNHPDYASSLSGLAGYYAFSGNYQKAIEVGTQALKIRESVLGRKHLDYMASLSNISNYYAYSGNYQKAIEMETQALKIMKSAFGIKNREYAISLSNLAHFYSLSGNYQKAIEIGTRDLKIKETVFGKTHPDYATSLSDLAGYYSDFGNYQKAVDIETQALKLRGIALGRNHPDYASSLNNLAYYFYYLGNYQKAIEIGTQALKIKETVLGKEHPEYATSLSNLAGYYSDLGNYQKAIELETQALKIRESVLDKNHPGYALSLSNLASYYSQFGNYQKAIELELQALKIRKSVLGKEHPNFALSLSNISNYYAYSGNYQKAIELGTQALKIRESVLGNNHPDYAASLSNLASDYSDSGNYQKAIELGTQALKIRESFLGENHPDYALSLGNLADYYLYMNNCNLALNYLIPYDRIIRNIIRSNFQTMTTSERYYFWNKYSNIYTNYLPSVDYKIRSEKTEGLCYNSQLLSKGLLLTMGTEMKRLIQESGDTSVITKYEALQQLRSTLRKVYELPISKRSMNTDSLETVAQQIEKELVKGSEQYGDFTRNMLMEWQDVQKELKNEDTAIEFVDFPISKDSIEYAAMVLRKGMECPKMIDLCLEPELLKHQKNGTRMYDGYENKTVYALIWKKLEPYLQEGGNVYFSPSGIIYQMNVEALKDSAGKMANEKYHLYRVSTTKELCYQNVAQKMKTATLYGGLTYDMDSTTMCNESRKYHPDANDYLAYRGCLPDSVSRGAWAELPQTGREVDMIANELKNVSVKTDVIKGISGTEESFKSLSGKKISVIHLATHGFFLKDEEASGKKFFQNIMQGNTGLRAFTNTSMKRSGLIFAGGQKAWLGGAVPGNVEDGILLAEEIPAIDLRGTDLLVLSACDTGLGEVNSEGVSGLQRGFKQAGVKTIVMSLWQVNDNATSLFMSQFYKNLTDGQTKQEAFMNAQKSLRDSHDFSDPKYWAAFIMLDAI